MFSDLIKRNTPHKNSSASGPVLKMSVSTNVFLQKQETMEDQGCPEPFSLQFTSTSDFWAPDLGGAALGGEKTFLTLM